MRYEQFEMIVKKSTPTGLFAKCCTELKSIQGACRQKFVELLNHGISLDILIESIRKARQPERALETLLKSSIRDNISEY